MIPMVDLKAQYHQLKDEIDAGIAQVLENTQFILGPNVQALEQELADYLGTPHAITCASGTDALHLALAAAGIGEGDEVITTAFTFIATAEAIRYVGAVPVFVDIDPRTFNIDVAQVEAAINERTRAIMPVHLFGQPADLSRLQALSKTHDLILVEDCAQSFGATVNGTQTGTTGAFGCFSFFPSKNLGCYGDGGLITTGSDAHADRLRTLRNHGSRVRYHHDIIGYNSRLDEIQAAILRVKLKHIDRFNRERRRAAHRYNALLADTPVTTPFEDGLGVHVFHQYTLLTDRRDAVMQALQQAGIACAVYYPIPLHRQKAFGDSCAQVHLPVTESVTERCLSLPIYPEIRDEDLVRITDIIRGALD
ncbi:DegT/DnrJ/EryC1/StrS family aminotransferase [Ectothiorhodospira lacustris]|uniref:DegT/DnrJ/EryC1/StrS family aminotransferase n=1 Tax=Ectothiorhodospira lacustris TaxID=2899127 RepID=UPI001EE784B6|nr:DegT/DnrJ/EryC1/StrS family aminotransferase [Ectothiorhodospira lacustris]MCG5500078.1 DegT/DnrJ/EryC1/StrS family aminotransferase [Ectothiorhodospira lacustris]MCG5509432.1 DegT/DnrJ/EryC1/StrS family aminotransferase [Ectothiorhodospira lacustris]MCG5521486.1 DegT/DnrJ/EryC1/StrS family aminotransferase [Ectothiorhodospira lacustris]